jgi:hypothetical protein
MLCALHLAAHGLSAKPLEDLRRALVLLTDVEWETAHALAVELGAQEAFGAGLRFPEAGLELADRLGLTPALQAHRLLQIDPAAPSSAWTLDTLLAQPSLSGFARSLRRVLAPSPQQMRRHFRLARRGRAGLLLAYSIRPLRLVGLTPRAVWFWLHAHRAAVRLARNDH